VASDRVAYGFELPDGLRVHTGFGVGHDQTAAAMVRDVARVLAAAPV
jgi:homoserine dehydrogenase